jgi:hypothetical protein
MNNLVQLAELIKEKNVVDGKIASILGRPAQVGHAGEYIAAALLGIQLHQSASHASSDGRFLQGPLTGRSVDIKWYLKHEGTLDLNPTTPPDYYFVLVGPKSASASSRGAVRPWVIESVFLFDASQILAVLRPRGIKLGIATSVASELWIRAEIYPVQQNHVLTVDEAQRQRLALFQ